MNRKLLAGMALGFFITNIALAQNAPAKSSSVPLYRVTVVERTVRAVNYQYRSGPTPIDFRGTVLLPDAKGDAMVESKAGRTEIDARFQHLAAPTRFGPEYLTYVLWAITPEGHPKNIGEIVAGSSDKAKLQVTTDLQAFGLIVTAEPYAAVRQPSDVVVLENQVRPDTIGTSEPIQVRYELLPRKEYTYDVQAGQAAAAASGPPVSMDQYQTTLAIYQAQNALQIAESYNAAQYAPEVMNKAQEQFQNAQNMREHKVDSSLVISAARQAAQTAQDARDLSIKRKQDAALAEAQAKAQQEQQLRIQAEADAQRARAQSSADRMQMERDRAAREDVPAQTAPAPIVAPPVVAPRVQPATQPSVQPMAPPQQDVDRQKRELRTSLLQQLSGVSQVRDTPRGLVVTIPDADFRGSAPEPGIAAVAARVAAVAGNQPGLTLTVEGNSDAGGVDGERLSSSRAEAVRDALVRSGFPAASVTARGLGNSRPLGPNTTAQDREQNRRVEITISGDPIGGLAYWDKTYSINPH